VNAFDVVVVGAGNAGLTAAATLQRGGARTLLVERHNVPGGAATSFRRGRFEFEVALHQLSGVGQDGQAFSLRDLLRRVGVLDALELVEERELYRTVVPGVLDVTLPADWGEAADAIEAAFPGNRAAVERFFALCREVTMWQLVARRAGRDPALAEQLTGPGAALLRHGLRPLQDVLDEHFDDERVAYVLAAYWSYLGQPPSRLPFLDIAILLFAYFEFKPFHIRGGSQMLSSALLDAFERAGGEVRLGTAVERILTRDGAVSGVRLDDGEEVACEAVVSNASPLVTYGRMLDPAVVPDAVRRDLRSRRVGVSAFVLHMGLDASPAQLGFTSSSNFVARTTDVDRQSAAMRTLEAPQAAMVSCYDVEPIGFSPAGASHVSLVTLQYASAWDAVAAEDYARVKFAYADELLGLMEQLTPGVRDVIEEVDVGTPNTMAHYLGHPGGAIYGFDQDATDGWLFRDDERAHVPGLHLAGAWAGMCGFQPTLESGARVGRRLLRAGAAAGATA
jgi:phytoene dehydrogenase-like protein